MKLNVELVGLDIRVSKFFFFLFLFISCAAPQKSLKITKRQNVQEVNYALNEAHRLYLFGNYNQASDIYKSCVAIDDSCAVGYFQLANIESINKNY